ncbi:MAG: hypothetical protein BroJett040_18240 [Oligoflexia bacterium]|nr:MAG: hypothetical protein BroJett040_18240 [Oligoflexia bacterium]
MMLFHNRQHAGQLLSEKLQKYKNSNAIVLPLPRGGVPVGIEVANALNLPMEVLVVRKIGAPFQTELAVGALCESEDPVWNQQILSRMGLEPDDLNSVVERERARIKQQIDLFREGRDLSSVSKKVAIIVDDGLATGATATAAASYLKRKGAAKVVIAVPVAAASSATLLRTKVDEVIVVDEREDLMSVGQWYRNFSQVSDSEVISLLRRKPIQKEKEKILESEREIPVDDVQLKGDLVIFPEMKGLIIFAHGSGSSRKSPRNRKVARYLNDRGFGTLLFDLLTDQESEDRRNVFNIPLLSHRLGQVTKWVREQSGFESVPLGYFGASTGAGAAIHAAEQLEKEIKISAVVSRGGRPDLAGEALKTMSSPTLLLVGSQDYGVIELNQQAQKLLPLAKLSLVDGATHLFEEPGTLEEVSQKAADWFAIYLQKNIKQKSKISLDLTEAIKESMTAIKSESDYDRLIQFVKSARVVMLGESSHGTEEFYKIRSLITKRLIKDYGFKFIAVEGDWPAAYRLHRYIKTGEGGRAQSVLMKNHRWPTWMWANEEIAQLGEWMRAYDGGFYGLDIYSLFESIGEVTKYLNKNYPDLAIEIERRYSCFDSYGGDELAYARSILNYPAGCEKEVLQNLQQMLNLRLVDWTQDEDELFNSQQNARIVASAEAYYRAMLRAEPRSWNVRDGHMMETLDRLLERAGEGAKAIVWAHNTHIGDYRATDMKENGFVSLGGLARQSYGEENVALVGFGTYQGDVLAGPAWGATEKVMFLPPALKNSYEHYFHKAAGEMNVNEFYVLLENKHRTPFGQRRGHRAVGVVYSPLHEQRTSYVPTELSRRYDAFVFVDQTHALKSLHSPYVRGQFPETWPSGQ